MEWLFRNTRYELLCVREKIKDLIEKHIYVCMKELKTCVLGFFWSSSVNCIHTCRCKHTKSEKEKKREKMQQYYCIISLRSRVQVCVKLDSLWN